MKMLNNTILLTQSLFLKLINDHILDINPPQYPTIKSSCNMLSNVGVLSILMKFCLLKRIMYSSICFW